MSAGSVPRDVCLPCFLSACPQTHDILSAMYDAALYENSPPWFQEILISARAAARRMLREGSRYRAHVCDVFERQSWSASQLRQYQLDRLHDVLAHAERHVPYYSHLFRRLGIRVGELVLPDDLARIPPMSKREILQAGSSLLSGGRSLGRIRGSTSGTTGTPVAIYQNIDAIRREHAFDARQLQWAGFERGSRRAWIRGDLIVPASDEQGPLWRMNRTDNMLLMSSYHLSEQTAPRYLEALAQFQPTMIEAYPSSIGFLARYLQSRSSRFPNPPRCIVTSSETLSSAERSLIEDRFETRVFDWYGSFERVVAIGTCEFGRHHLLTDYSYVEFEPAGDGMWEMLGTGFNNLAMPLIRFRTGDLVSRPTDDTRCACGRNFPVIEKIIGRQDAAIMLSSGRVIGRLDHIFKGVEGIAEAQIVQRSYDEVCIRVVPFGTLSRHSEHALIENARRRLGDEVRVNVEAVASLPRSRSGKLQAVVRWLGRGRLATVRVVPVRHIGALRDDLHVPRTSSSVRVGKDNRSGWSLVTDGEAEINRYAWAVSRLARRHCVRYPRISGIWTVSALAH